MRVGHKAMMLSRSGPHKYNILMLCLDIKNPMTLHGGMGYYTNPMEWELKVRCGECLDLYTHVHVC